MARHRHPFENRYCNGCQCTTRHEVKETSFSCLRCGAIKYPATVAKASAKLVIQPQS